MTRAPYSIRSPFLAPRSRAFFKRQMSKRSRAIKSPDVAHVGKNVARDLGIIERSWLWDLHFAAESGEWDYGMYETDCDVMA